MEAAAVGHLRPCMPPGQYVCPTTASGRNIYGGLFVFGHKRNSGPFTFCFARVAKEVLAKALVHGTPKRWRTTIGRTKPSRGGIVHLGHAAECNVRDDSPYSSTEAPHMPPHISELRRPMWPRHYRKAFRIIIQLMLGPALCALPRMPAAAQGAALPTPRGVECSYASETATYVTDEQLRELRKDFAAQKGLAYSNLDQTVRSVVSEALRIGPAPEEFAAFVLRDLLLIKEFEQQSSCADRPACNRPEEIRYFKTGESWDPNRDKTWMDLVHEWQHYRDLDAAAATHCLAGTKDIATRHVPAPAMVASTEAHPASRPQSCRALARHYDIHFSFAHYSPSDADKVALLRLAARLSACRASIAIDGFAESAGSAAYNMRLSTRRAAQVEHIMQLEAPVLIASIDAHGSARPIASNRNRTGRATNRRVEITIVDPPD